MKQDVHRREHPTAFDRTTVHYGGPRRRATLEEMRSRVLDVVLFAVGLAVGAGGVKLSSHPPSAAPEAASAPPERPPEPTVVRGPADDADPAVRDRVRALDHEARRIGAVPTAWPDDVRWDLRPEQVHADHEARILKAPERFEGVETRIDCSEYPCLVIYEHERRAAANAHVRGRGGIDAQHRHCSA